MSIKHLVRKEVEKGAKEVAAEKQALLDAQLVHIMSQADPSAIVSYIAGIRPHTLIGIIERMEEDGYQWSSVAPEEKTEDPVSPKDIDEMMGALTTYDDDDDDEEDY